MLLTIMAVLDRRPALAGILIGLLPLKPQLGLLFPVMLAARLAQHDGDRTFAGGRPAASAALPVSR